MTIQSVKLTDKFHVWVATTNLILEEVNREIVLEAKQKLKTIDKSTLVNAINELVDKKLNKDEDITLSNNTLTVNQILSNTKIQVGSESNGNSIIEFYDDTEKLYRKFLFNKDDQKWYLENADSELELILTNKSVIDGDQQTIMIKGLDEEEFNTYTGPERTFSYNLVTKEVRIHDGFTEGGISLLQSSIETDKVKTSQNDTTAGYLVDKIKVGDGLQIIENSVSGGSNLTITNNLSIQFADAQADTYLKRDSNNQIYNFLTKQQLIEDLDLGKIYSNTKTITDVIILEDNIYTYILNVSSDTNISFNTGELTHKDQMCEFEFIVDIQTISNITFNDTIKWNNNETAVFDKVGIYICKFKSIDSGVTWLAKLDGFYE